MKFFFQKKISRSPWNLPIKKAVKINIDVAKKFHLKITRQIEVVSTKKNFFFVWTTKTKKKKILKKKNFFFFEMKFFFQNFFKISNRPPFQCTAFRQGLQNAKGKRRRAQDRACNRTNTRRPSAARGESRQLASALERAPLASLAPHSAPASGGAGSLEPAKSPDHPQISRSESGPKINIDVGKKFHLKITRQIEVVSTKKHDFFEWPTKTKKKKKISNCFFFQFW